MRLLAVLVLVGCGSTSIRVGRTEATVRRQAAKSFDMIAFVAEFDEEGRKQLAAEHALRLEDGDWLASFGGATARLSASGALRWSRPISSVAAVEAGTNLIVVDRLADRTAIQAQTITAFDRTGHTLWTARPQHAIGYTVRALRIGATTVIATERGVAGLDDTGAVLWDTPHKASTVVAAAFGENVVVATSTNSISSDEIVKGIERKEVCRARLLDARTGTERAAVEHAPKAHLCTAWDLATTRTKVVVRIADVEHRFDGETTSSVAAGRFLVLDPKTLGETAVIDEPTPPRTAALPTRLAAEELAFLDGYATGKEALGLTIVDLATGDVRRATVIEPQHVSVGEGLDSTVQLKAIQHERGRITFAGQFVGALRLPNGSRLRAEVREVDACDAAGGIECSRRQSTVEVAPFAAVIGMLIFEQ